MCRNCVILSCQRGPKITVLFSTSTPRMKADLKGTGVPNKLASGAHSSFWFYIFISTVPPPEDSLPQLVKKKCSACLNKEPFTTSLSNLFIFFQMFLKVDYFMFSVSPAKYSPLLVKPRKEVPVMLVTKGIDIYTVDSRFLYCGFSI